LDPKELLRIRDDSLGGKTNNHNLLNIENAGLLKGSKIIKSPADKRAKKLKTKKNSLKMDEHGSNESPR